MAARIVKATIQLICKLKGRAMCKHCKSRFQPGQLVVSMPAPRKAKYYCISCALQLNIIDGCAAWRCLPGSQAPAEAAGRNAEPLPEEAYREDFIQHLFKHQKDTDNTQDTKEANKWKEKACCQQ